MHRIALVSLIALLTIAVCHAQDTNMIRNPGFEEGQDAPAQWQLGMEGVGAGSARWVTENPHSGRYCVRLEMEEAGNYWMARQTYEKGTALPEHVYQIRGRYRSTGDVAHPCVYFKDAAGQFLGAWEVALPPTELWRPFCFVFKSQAGTDHFELQMRAQGGPGVCFFDDLALEDGEALVADGEAMVAPLLRLAADNRQYLWAIVADGGTAQFELVGAPAAEVAWAVSGGAAPAGCGVRVEHADGAHVQTRLLAEGPANAELKTAALPAGGYGSTRIVAYSQATGVPPVLLVGIKASAAVRASLMGASATPLATAPAGLELPWQTRLLPATVARLSQIRQSNRDRVLAAALGLPRGQAATRVCSAWLNNTDEQWLRWAVEHGHEPPAVAAGVRNEYLSLQVLFVSGAKTEKLQATVSDLTGPGGAGIPAARCQVRMLDYVPFAGKWLPDPLMEDQPFTAPEHGPIVLWLTVHVPADAVAGKYTGRLSITPQGAAATETDFQIRVWDADLPPETHLQSSFWLFRGQINQFFGLDDDVAMEDYYPYIDLATSHRLSPIDTLEGPTVPLVTVYREEDGTLSYDFSQWDKYLDRMRLGGANTIHLGFTHWMAHYFTGSQPKVIDRKSGETTAPGHEFGSPQHLDALGHFLRAAADHLKQRGEFDYCYIQPWDEPYGEGLDKSYQILKGIKERVPDIPRLMDAIYPDAHEGKMESVVNLWCPLSPQVEGGRFDAMRDRGDTIWWYVCCGPREPYANLFTNWKVAEMRALFWQTWQYRVTGVLYWGLNYWLSWGAEMPPVHQRFPNGPWSSSTTSEAGNHMGDGYFFYPGPAVDRPLSSLRLETIRDGIEDYELLYRLDELVRTNPEADAEALALAQEVLKVRPQVSQNLRQFDREGTAMDAERELIARLISRLGK